MKLKKMSRLSFAVKIKNNAEPKCLGPASYCQRTKIIYAARKKLAARPSARGAGYSEDLSAQRSASGKATLSAADGAGHRKRKRQRTVVRAFTTEQAIGFPQSLYDFAG